jgi:hypothetical protein
MELHTKFIHHNIMQHPFDVQRLDFIGQKYPKIILILNQLCISIDQLNAIMTCHNELITMLLSKERVVIYKHEANLSFEITDNLEKQINSVIFFSKKVHSLLSE